MAASKDDQSVTESVEVRSQHDSRLKNPITNNDQHWVYPKNDRGPYDESEAILGGETENENMYDYPANNSGYDIQGPQGQKFQQYFLSYFVFLDFPYQDLNLFFQLQRLKFLYIIDIDQKR